MNEREQNVSLYSRAIEKVGSEEWQRRVEERADQCESKKYEQNGNWYLSVTLKLSDSPAVVQEIWMISGKNEETVKDGESQLRKRCARAIVLYELGIIDDKGDPVEGSGD